MNSKSFMSKVYLLMSLGLFVTGIVTFFVVKISLANLQFALTITRWAWVIFIVQLILTVGISNVYKKTSVAATTLLYLFYCVLTGLWMGPLIMTYDIQALLGSIAAVVVLFVIVAIWATFTKRDLTSWGSFALIGLLGMLIASFFNIFLYALNPGLATSINWAVTYFGVIIFLALLAFSIQSLNELSKQVSKNKEIENQYAVIGAFGLYLNVINLFLLLLRILGRK